MVASRQYSLLMASLFGALFFIGMLVEVSDAQPWYSYALGYPFYSPYTYAWPYSSYFSAYGLGLWGKREAGFGPSEAESSVAGTTNLLDAAQGPHSLLDGLKP